MLVAQLDELGAFHLERFMNQTIEVRGWQSLGIRLGCEFLSILELREPLLIFVSQSRDTPGMVSRVFGERLDIGKGSPICMLRAIRSSRCDSPSSSMRHAPDEKRQGEALENERHKNDGKRQKDDLVAAREGRSACDRDGKRKRCRQRDNAAHSRPSHDRDVLPSG